MKMKFKCTLLSDVVLNRTSSSEGKQSSLDFIPGNNFLGIVASSVYNQLSSQDSEAVFHSGKVRFGDAHPSALGIRGLKVPASMFYPKMGTISEKCYIHHCIDCQDEDLKKKQLKQCREGFYVFEEDKKTGTKISFDKHFSIKSAYDSEKRRSKDKCMFGYESLPAGQTLFFEVESDLEGDINNVIKNALVGKKRIGRSRSAEYGLVQIEETDYQDNKSSASNGNGTVVVYADGRLIFLNENGEPTFQPEAEDFGFTDGIIVWEKSQIRTFQYSPWNSKRHTYDIDRCGIEKGSVIVIDNCSQCPTESRYVGSYKNEGFGKVIFNPDFLSALPNENGLAVYKLEESSSDAATGKGSVLNPDSALTKYLLQMRVSDTTEKKTYDSVRQFIQKNEDKFKKGDGQFASQWGSIRSLAMVIANSEKLIDAIDNFLSHGVAKDKWEERGRKKVLDEFMNNHIKDNLQDIIINLASEMAKKCKNEKEG